MIKKLRPKYRVLYTFRALYGSMYRGANRVEGKLPSLLGRACEAVRPVKDVNGNRFYDAG